MAGRVWVKELGLHYKQIDAEFQLIRPCGCANFSCYERPS